MLILSKLDDGASSIVSFEDVGSKSSEDFSTHKELIIRDPRFKAEANTLGETVPEVRYFLQYKGLAGHVITCKCLQIPAAKKQY